MAKQHNMPYRLYKRGEVYHAYISFVDASGARIQLRETTGRTGEQEASEYCLQRIAAIQKKSKQTASGELPRITVDEAFGLFFEQRAKYYARPQETLRKLNLIKNNLTCEYLDQIDTSELLNYIQRRKPRVCNGTINRELVIISGMITQCRLLKYKTSDVHPTKLRLREPAENIKYLQNWDIAQKIIDRAADHLKPIIYTAIYTGLRRGNILRLKWQDVDFQNDLITVKVKDKTTAGGKNLTIPMIDKLKAIILAQPRISDFIFTYNGHPISDIKHSWHSIFFDHRGNLKDPTLPYINFHALRHTAATWILKKTGNLRITKEILGHANINTTMKYAHVLDDEKRNALNKVFN